MSDEKFWINKCHKGKCENDKFQQGKYHIDDRWTNDRKANVKMTVFKYKYDSSTNPRCIIFRCANVNYTSIRWTKIC